MCNSLCTADGVAEFPGPIEAPTTELSQPAVLDGDTIFRHPAEALLVHFYGRAKRTATTETTEIPVYGTLVCNRVDPSGSESFSLTMDFININLNFFALPRNETCNSYFSDMECKLKFTAPEGMKMYVEFPTCELEEPLDECGDDYIRVLYQEEDGDGTSKNKTICRMPSVMGPTDTHLNSLDITFSSNSIKEGYGCSGFFLAYTPESDTEPDGM